VGENKAERGILPTEMPTPIWPEVAQWATSVKLLRPICELSIDYSESAPAAAQSSGSSSKTGGAEEPESATTDVTPPLPPPGSSASSLIGLDDGVDPALWYCQTLNRLQMRLQTGILTSLRGDGLAKLTNLTTLIVSGNSLTW
jgi:hypothetical protein